MRLTLLALVAIALGGCGPAPGSDHGRRPGGRYAGIGIYAAGDLWQRMAAAARPADAAAATLRDDDTVIVVVDSHTGEVRQCGNLSGYCIRMNPWSGPLGRAQAAPVNLTEHRADLDRAAGQEAAATANAAQPVSGR